MRTTCLILTTICAATATSALADGKWLLFSLATLTGLVMLVGFGYARIER